MFRGIRIIASWLLAWAAIATVALWSWSFQAPVALQSAASDVTLGRFRDAARAYGLMDDEEYAGHVRLHELGQESAGFQRQGWEERVGIPAYGWRISVYGGIVTVGIADYRGLPAGVPRSNLSYLRSSGTLWIFGAWYHNSAPFGDQWAFYFRRITTPLLVVLLSSYPAIAFLHGPVRRWHRRRRGLCVKCGYNLTGLTEPRCPECGTVFQSRKRDEN